MCTFSFPCITLVSLLIQSFCRLNKSRSQRIVWLLEELGVPYDVEIFYRDKQTFLAPPELKKIHALGKSPILSITPPASLNGEAQQEEEVKPIILAESGFMTQYVCEHFPAGRDRLTPRRWREGKEGQVGGETEEYLRWQYFLHYNEGSLMALIQLIVVISRLKSPSIPFLIRPITSTVAGRIYSSYVYPNARGHVAMIDEQLATSPGGGKYLCGTHLTAADILMSFPLIAARQMFKDLGPWEGGSWEAEFPRVKEYVDMLEAEDGFKRSEEKVRVMEGREEKAAL